MGLVYTSRVALPRSTIFPNRFLLVKKFLVEQFQRRLRNWCWHSCNAIFTPRLIACNTPGFSRIKRLCLLRNNINDDESINIRPGVVGAKLLGSPALAIPLRQREGKMRYIRPLRANHEGVTTFIDHTKINNLNRNLLLVCRRINVLLFLKFL